MKAVKRIVSYPLSIIFYLFFGLTLVIFHPLQWLALKIGGKQRHRSVVNIMNLCLLRCLHFLLCNFRFINHNTLPQDRPLIIVSNHQSMFDIPLISWYLRKQKPKFISKIELGKGIPSVSFNLNHGDHLLIDRKNPKQSVPALSQFGTFIKENNFAAVIFPEGTRSKTGEPKIFAPTGLKILFKKVPNALIVPVTINNSWKLLQYGNFPMGIGLKVTLEVQEPLEIDAQDIDTLLVKIRERVVSRIHT